MPACLHVYTHAFSYVYYTHINMYADQYVCKYKLVNLQLPHLKNVSICEQINHANSGMYKWKIHRNKNTHRDRERDIGPETDIAEFITVYK